MPAEPDPTGTRVPARHHRRERLFLLVLRLMLALPYRFRVRLAGLAGALAGRLPGRLPRRIAAAVRHFRPELPPAEVARIARTVPANLARALIEEFSGREFAEHARASPIEGPGLTALEAARDAGRPAVLVTAHFGNYDAWRGALIRRGFRIGAYYKPMAGDALNRAYVRAMAEIGTPLFPAGREGLAGVVKFLRAGGMVGILIDLDRPNGMPIDFLGRPTRTVLSPAELALRYEALLVPVWAIRLADGLSFRIQVDAPVPRSTPEAMTRALNDALGAMVRAHPEQWLWWHNRRKKSHP